MIKDATVYPGCTLADKTIDFVASGLPTVKRGISLPSYVLPNDSYVMGYDDLFLLQLDYIDLSVFSNLNTLLYSYGKQYAKSTGQLSPVLKR